jgi:hypothetical protein
MAKKRGSTARSASVQRAPAPSGSIVEVICSNCIEEFGYRPSGSGEAIICPACDHSCDTPDEAQLHRIADLRKSERNGYVLNFILFMVFLISAFAAMYLIQDPTVNDQDNPAMFYGPGAVAVLSCLILLITSIKYETNRWETYF